MKTAGRPEQRLGASRSFSDIKPLRLVRACGMFKKRNDNKRGEKIENE